MIAFIERLHSNGSGATREDARRIAQEQKAKPTRGRPRHFVFKYQPREKTFSLSLQFRKAQVPREEVVAALQAIIAELMAEREAASA
jgi:hypothetical protein